MHPTRVFVTQDGSRSLFSERFGVSYHSKYGAWRETQHVFVEAGLRFAAVDAARVRVLDIGYGTGLNCIASLLHARSRGLPLHYVGVEAYPPDAATLNSLDYPSCLDWDEAEAQLWHWLNDIPWPGRATYGSRTEPDLHVEKRLMKFEDLADVDSFDLIYYDAFAPEAQPELWTPELFARMYAALSPGGILVTYCAKGQVKRDMRSVGFSVERLAGPPGKREMTRATRPEL